MNSKLIVLILIVGFSSCSTIYKSGQTPDDVYFSPAPPQGEYVSVKNSEDNNSGTYDNSTYEDREIRRGIYNPRLRSYDNYDNSYYGNNYQGNYGFNDPLSYNAYSSPFGYYSPNSYLSYSYLPLGYSGYNYSYYPYYNNYYQPIYNTVKAPVNYNQPRTYNLEAYGNHPSTPILRPANTTGILRPTSSSTQSDKPVTQPNGTGVGNFIRRVFTNPDNNNNSDYSNQNRNEPVRNTTQNNSPSNNSSSSSSSSGGNGSSAPVRTFR